MFKKKQVVKESALDELRQKAMKNEDYVTVMGLNDIESEMKTQLVKVQLKGIIYGYGSAMAGVTLGAIVVNRIKKK
jgi:hypothetical protein